MVTWYLRTWIPVGKSENWGEIPTRGIVCSRRSEYAQVHVSALAAVTLWKTIPKGPCTKYDVYTKIMIRIPNIETL